MNNIFKLIKLQDYTTIKSIIEADITFDINIYDEQNNYLIHYILLYNQIEILKIILNRNIRLDILDFDGRTILHIPIKYNFIDILKLLLEYNNKLIGISIIDIKDKYGLSALHYCIIFNNYECFILLRNKNADIMSIDNNGNNVVNLALEYKNMKIINNLIETINLNTVYNSNNETLLQIAIRINLIPIINILLNNNIDLNNQESIYGFSALHQSIIYHKINITKKLISKGIDINLQDYSGNTALMYAIYDKLYDYIILLLNFNIQYNLTNLIGETGLHIILNNYNDFIAYPHIIENIIQNTDLNIQDNKGNTCLFYIIHFNLLHDYKHILENKELNIFIKNNNNISSYEMIKHNDNDLNIIINSYYNNLLLNKNKLIIPWEKQCSINIKICKQHIKNIIIKENRSIPKLKEYNLILDNGIFVNTCYYTGAPIDFLFGLLFIYNKFKHLHINLIIDYPLTINNELSNYYTSLGLDYKFKLDFCNFEIIWLYQKLIIPSYFKFELIKKIKISNYIIIPIGIETELGAHANILFYNIKKSHIERFEPNGANEPHGLNYNSQLLDQLLEQYFKTIDNTIIYIRANKYLPSIGFQILENINNIQSKRIGDPNGFCCVWCIWWVYHKLKNIKLESTILANKLINEIKLLNLNFKILIRNFSKNISDLRDIFLSKYNIDINDFIVGNYDINLLNKLELDIIKFIC